MTYFSTSRAAFTKTFWTWYLKNNWHRIIILTPWMHLIMFLNEFDSHGYWPTFVSYFYSLFSADYKTHYLLNYIHTYTTNISHTYIQHNNHKVHHNLHFDPTYTTNYGPTFYTHFILNHSQYTTHQGTSHPHPSWWSKEKRRWR